MNDAHPWPTPTEQPDEFHKLPGLFRGWEIEQVLEQGATYYIEGAGNVSDGIPLFAVFRQELQEDKEDDK